MLITDLKVIYNRFPRKFFTTFSWSVDNFQSFINALNSNISHSRCSSSIYDYNKSEYDCTIDRVAWDLDSKDSHTDTLKLHDYLMDLDIKHFIVASGANYHVYAKVEGNPIMKKDCVKNITKSIAEKLNIDVDRSLHGNLSHNLSIPGSFNFKRGRYVRFVNENDLFKGHDYVKQLCKIQGGNLEFYGKDGINSLEYDNISNVEVIKFEESYECSFVNEKLYNDFPLELKHLLNDKDAGHRTRLKAITLMYEFGLNKQSCIDILKKWLPPVKFYHCVVIECQVDWIYRRKNNKIIHG